MFKGLEFSVNLMNGSCPFPVDMPNVLASRFEWRFKHYR